MKIVVDVKNTSKIKKNDVILYDGKEWYVMTKDELMKELETRAFKVLSDVQQTMMKMQQDYATFMQNYNEQNSKLLPILQQLLEKDE